MKNERTGESVANTLQLACQGALGFGAIKAALFTLGLLLGMTIGQDIETIHVQKLQPVQDNDEGYTPCQYTTKLEMPRQ